MTTTIDTRALLDRMRTLSQEARALPAWEPRTGKGEFERVFQASLASVNGLQQQASGLAEAFERGEPAVSLAEVTVAREKASLAFQAALQVRNKLVSAYQDIMNMPI
jgi:flagellar hook-basal body complex protein FliE